MFQTLKSPPTLANSSHMVMGIVKAELKVLGSFKYVIRMSELNFLTTDSSRLYEISVIRPRISGIVRD